NGGMRELSAEEPQPHGSRMWMPFFTVTSAASATDTATAPGGSVPYGPARVGAGTTAVVNDPPGAVFGVHEGEGDSQVGRPAPPRNWASDRDRSRLYRGVRVSGCPAVRARR